MQFFFLFEVFYCAAIIPIKLAISIMLIRIASNKPLYTQCLYVVSGMFIIMNLIAMLYIIFHCTPVRYGNLGAFEASSINNCYSGTRGTPQYLAASAIRQFALRKSTTQQLPSILRPTGSAPSYPSPFSGMFSSIAMRSSP